MTEHSAYHNVAAIKDEPAYVYNDDESEPADVEQRQVIATEDGSVNVNVRKDVWSPDVATVKQEIEVVIVKEEIDIGLTVLQPPDIYFVPRLCKYEPTDEPPLLFHSMTETNTDDSHEERKRKRQINNSPDDGKVEEERRKNREKCKRYRLKKNSKVAALPISVSCDSVEKSKEEERKQKNREKTKRWRENKKKNIEVVNNIVIKNTYDSHEVRKIKKLIKDSSGDGKVEEERRKNREKCKRYRQKKKNVVAALPISGSFDFDEKRRNEERKQKNREKTKRCRENKKKRM